MSERETLVEKFYQLKSYKENIKSKLDEVNKELEETENTLILLMENENLASFKDARFGTFFLRTDMHASIANPDEAFAWLREKGHQDVIKETVHHKTLAAIAKEVGDIPGVKAFYKTSIGIRK